MLKVVLGFVKDPPPKKKKNMYKAGVDIALTIVIPSEMKVALRYTQRPKNLGGRVALPSGKFLRVRKVFARNP